MGQLHPRKDFPLDYAETVAAGVKPDMRTSYSLRAGDTVRYSPSYQYLTWQRDFRVYGNSQLKHTSKYDQQGRLLQTLTEEIGSSGASLDTAHLYMYSYSPSTSIIITNFYTGGLYDSSKAIYQVMLDTITTSGDSLSRRATYQYNLTAQVPTNLLEVIEEVYDQHRNLISRTDRDYDSYGQGELSQAIFYTYNYNAGGQIINQHQLRYNGADSVLYSSIYDDVLQGPIIDTLERTMIQYWKNDTVHISITYKVTHEQEHWIQRDSGMYTGPFQLHYLVNFLPGSTLPTDLILFGGVANNEVHVTTTYVPLTSSPIAEPNQSIAVCAFNYSAATTSISPAAYYTAATQVTLQLYDVHGRVVWTAQAEAGEEVKLLAPSPGLHILEAQGDNYRCIGRVW